MAFGLFYKHVPEPATPAEGPKAAAAAEVLLVAETHSSKEILRPSSLSSADKERSNRIQTSARRIGNGDTVMIVEIDVPVCGPRPRTGFRTDYKS